MQNVYQWKAFAVCKERIGKKNGLQELGEKFLYHGTAAESCDSIEKGRFDRSFAGQHGKDLSCFDLKIMMNKCKMSAGPNNWVMVNGLILQIFCFSQQPIRSKQAE